MNRVLSLSLRPKSLDAVYGQESLITAIKNQFESKRVPHFYIISGEIGSGKTTLARIISGIIQTGELESGTGPQEKFDTTEINASNENGIAFIRNIIEVCKFKPVKPSLAKIFIFDEAHQLTKDAQNTMLKLTEDTPDHVFIIFCTNCVSKILASLRRRAYMLETKPFDDEHVFGYVTGVLNDLYGHQQKGQVLPTILLTENCESLIKSLISQDIRSPGLILQVLEKYVNGAPLADCFQVNPESSLDTLNLCRLVYKGSVRESLKVLKDAKASDIYGIRNSILGYLKSVLVSPDTKNPMAISQAIVIIGSSPLDDLPMFLANVCLACEKLKPKGST